MFLINALPICYQRQAVEVDCYISQHLIMVHLIRERIDRRPTVLHDHRPDSLRLGKGRVKEEGTVHARQIVSNL